MGKVWNAAKERVEREWTSLTDHAWYWYMVLSHFVNGLEWDDARDEAAEVMQAVFEQRYRDWLDGNKAWRACVRQAGIDWAEDMRAKNIPEIRELISQKNLNVEGTFKELEAVRNEYRETGVHVWQVDEALSEVERLLKEAQGQGTGQAKAV